MAAFFKNFQKFSKNFQKFSKNFHFFEAPPSRHHFLNIVALSSQSTTLELRKLAKYYARGANSWSSQSATLELRKLAKYYARGDPVPSWSDGNGTTLRIIQKTFLTQRSESPLSGEHGSGWSRKDTPAGDFLPQIATCAARPVSKLLGDDLLAKTRMSNRKPTKFVIAQSSSPNNLPRGTIQT